MRLTRRHIILIGLIGILLVFGAKAVADLWKVLAWEWRGAMDPDALDYFFVARGLLKGWTLYADIYEAKPPGIFWLMGSSLLLTGDERFLSAVQVAMYVSLPLIFGTYCIDECRRRSTPLLRAMCAVIVGLLTSVLLTLYLEERAGMMQTESFGGYFGVLYVLSVAWGDGVCSKRRIALSSCLLFLSLWMKEPFLLTTLGSALALSRGWKSFLRSFVIPLGLSGVAWIILLALFGSLKPYVLIHLPTMLWGRVAHDPYDPLWLRWLSVRWLLGNMTSYHSSAPQFGYLLMLLLFLAALGRSRSASRIDTATTVAGTLVATVLIYYSYFAAVILNAYRLGLQLASGQAFVAIVRNRSVLFALLTGMVWTMAYRRKLLAPILAVLAGLCLASMAVGISVYTDNHFAFAVPFYAALLVLFMQYAASQRARSVLVVPVLALTLLVAGTYRTDAKHLANLEERTRFTYASQKPVVDRLDRLLESCGFSTYYSYGVWQHFAFTRHPHAGPMVVLSYVNYLANDHYLIQQTLSHIVERVPVIITDTETTTILSDSVDALIRSRFTAEPPTCARPFLPFDGYRLLFRI